MKANIINLLLEANIINITNDYQAQSVTKYVTELLQNVFLPNRKQDFIKKLIKIITTEGIATQHLSDLPNEAPTWAIDAYERGDLVYFNISQFPDIEDKFDHIRDYIMAIADDLDNGDQNAKLKATKEIENFIKAQNFALLVKRSNDYFKSSVGDKNDLSGLEYLFDGIPGFKWYRLATDAACRREGPILQNCIGRIYTPSSKPKDLIFILKSEKGDSHVAIRINNRSLQEVKGKNNRPPISLYMKSVVIFFSKYKDVSINSIANNNDISNAGYVYDTDTSKFLTLTEYAKRIFANNVREVASFKGKPIMEIRLNNTSEQHTIQKIFTNLFNHLRVYGLEFDQILYVPKTNLAVVAKNGKVVDYTKAGMEFILENAKMDNNADFVLFLYRNKLITNIDRFTSSSLKDHDTVVTDIDDGSGEITTDFQHICQNAVEQSFTKTANVYELPTDTNTTANLLSYADIPFHPERLFLTLKKHKYRSKTNQQYILGAVDETNTIHLYAFDHSLNTGNKRGSYNGAEIGVQMFPLEFVGNILAYNSSFVDDDEANEQSISTYHDSFQSKAWIKLINQNKFNIDPNLQMMLGVIQTDNGYVPIDAQTQHQQINNLDVKVIDVSSFNNMQLLGYLGTARLASTTDTNLLRQLHSTLIVQVYDISPKAQHDKNDLRDDQAKEIFSLRNDIQQELNDYPNAIVNQNPTKIILYKNACALVSDNKVLLVQHEETHNRTKEGRASHGFASITKLVQQLLSNGLTLGKDALRYSSRIKAASSGQIRLRSEIKTFGNNIEHKTTALAAKDKKTNEGLSFVKKLKINNEVIVEQMNEDEAAEAKTFDLEVTVPNLVFKMTTIKDPSRPIYILATKTTIVGIRNTNNTTNMLSTSMIPYIKAFMKHSKLDTNISGINLTEKQLIMLQHIKNNPKTTRSATLGAAGIGMGSAPGFDASYNLIDRILVKTGLVKNVAAKVYKFEITPLGEKILQQNMAAVGTNLLVNSSAIPDLPVEILETHEAKEAKEQPIKAKKTKTIKETFLQWIKKGT